ncbi:hypothetical protein IQ215_09610 [Cyanobacterium stanieri LEGE 03274]|uniref:Uncharacterized protein n=1 Tax=Cyanobacterium stanieri LEGE 03274 TaxID=1828756 RepID=A0ABR9V7Z8_9CHRO|nr:hypothetical protein [Cyanobacterium stanieri]MBE9222949.1 hypothetical protein [Cyanobacterium stanieri LEGE 03274]
MEILSLEHLQTYGVKSEEIQKGLKINCFGKCFLRQSDVPKKFREKALILSAESLSKGKQSFVTETNFSYTVWAEEKLEVKNKSSVSREVNNIDNNPSTGNGTNSWGDNSRTLGKKNTNNINKEKAPRNISIVEKEKDIQWNISTRDKTPPVITEDSLPQTSSQNYKAYRGVAFTNDEKEGNNQANGRMRKKPRTYRGQIY